MEAHWIVLAAIGIVSLVVSSLIIHAYERKIDDEYAKTVIPLIQRILADDYTGSGLFEAIDTALKAVEEE